MSEEKLKPIMDIIKFNRSAEKIYEEIAQLEIDGKLGTPEHEELLDVLCMIWQMVDRKLRYMNLNNEELMQASELIGALNRLDDPEHDVVFDVLSLSKTNYVRKVLNQLFEYSRLAHSFVMENVGDTSDFTSEELEVLDEIMTEEIKLEDNLDLLKDKLLSHTLVSYIEEAIQNEKNPKVKNELIRVKYRLIFLIPNLEDNYIRIPDDYLKVPVYQELLRLNIEEHPDLYYECFLEPVLPVIEKELDKLFSVNDTANKGYIQKTKLILRKLYIKTFISIIYDETLLSELTDKRDVLKDTTESSFDKRNIDDVFKLSKHLSIVKNVDL